MTAYRIVWTILVGLLVARGVAVGADRHLVLTATLFLLGAAAGVAWSLGTHRRPLGVAAVVGATAAAVAGHASVLGGGVVLIGLLALATAPGLLRHGGRRDRVPGDGTAWDALVRGFANATPGYVPPVGPARFSDEELRAAWSRSASALRDARTAARVIELVELRDAYLDELERRDPVRAAQLLPTGSAVDWDALLRRCGS